MPDHPCSQTDVAVIVVNYNTAQLTIECVESVLLRCRGKRGVAIYILDNASPLGDHDTLSAALVEREWDSTVRLLCETTNHGFGRGINLIVQGLTGPLPRYVFLLNPDASVQNDAVNILADFLDDNPRVSAAGAKITNLAGAPVTAAFRFPSTISTFEAALCFGPVSRMLRRWAVPLPADISTQRVDWVAGAAVMIRTSDLRRAGLFDPAYFLYYEEVDLMRTITLQGGEIWFVAEACVVHIEGAATGVKSGQERPRRLPSYWYESWAHYFSKNHGRGGALLAAAAWYAGAVGNALISRVRGRSSQAPEHFYQDFWRVAVRPLFGLGPMPDE